MTRWRTHRRMCGATIPTGSIRIFRRSLAKTAPRRARRWRAGRRSICASTRSKPSARRLSPSSRTLRSSRRDGRRLVCVFGFQRTLKIPPSTRSPPFSRARLKFRTKARSLPPCLPAPRPASRSSIWRPAPAAVTENTGQIYATDIDKRQLAPIHERFARAGARNIQVRTPRGEADVLADLAGRIDLVMIDAPCTGTGTWRRNPDAKWRVRPGALAERLKQQEALLDRAAALVKAGGRIAYITCSVLGEENGDQVRAFLSRRGNFSVVPPREIAAAALGERGILFCHAARLSEQGLLMTPRTTDTDGFYVAVMRRGSA